MKDRARSRCRRELELLAGSTLDVDSVRIEAIEHLRRAIGFDLWCSPLVDPETVIPYRPVVSDALPFGDWLPRFVVQDQRLAEINSRTSLARARENACVLSTATGGDLARSRRWRECAAPVGIGDELRAAIVDEYGCWGSFEALRASDDPPFSDDDAELMGHAGRVLARRVREASVGARFEEGIEPGETGVLLIDDDLQPRGFTRAARDWFVLVKKRENADSIPLPTHVYALVGRLLAVEAGEEPDRRPRVRVRTAHMQWTTIEAARIEGASNAIAISVHGATTDDVLALVSRARGLTARERELVELVLDGLSTRELADRMFISPYTVKDHLKSVFEKLGVRSRRELVTGVFGQAA